MRTTLTILILFFLSCDNKTKKDGLEEKPILENREDKSDDIVGDWGIYVTSDGSLSANCNDCPRVFFKEDGTGTITFPTGTTEQIEWTRQKDKLTIKNIIANSQVREFDNGDYSVNLIKTKTFLEMTLTKMGQSNYFILRR